MIKYLLIALMILSCNQNKSRPLTKEVELPATHVTDSIPEAVIKPAAVVHANQLIIPGESMGLTSINENADMVCKVLGKPDKGDAAMGKSLYTWYSKPVITAKDTIINETNIFFIRNMGAVDEASRVDHIRVTSPFFMTREKIKVGSGIDDIKKQFTVNKIASYVSDKKKQTIIVYDDQSTGIAFEIDAMGICTGITVHKSHKRAFETYIPFFRDFKIL